MNTYLVASSYDDYGSFTETTVKADIIDWSPDGQLLFCLKDTFETVAVFAKGCWSRVTKEVN